MKKTIGISIMLLMLFSGLNSFGQKGAFYTKKGVVLDGYDLVSYFEGTSKRGVDDFSTVHEGYQFKFTSKEHLDKFKASPEKFLPQYGGYCAYGIADPGKKYSVDPETYEIRDGKLYFFYNKGKNNVLEWWLNGSPEELKKKADANWAKIEAKRK